MKNIILLWILFSSMTNFVYAQELVAHINPDSQDGFQGHFHTNGVEAVFFANDEVRGTEIYKVSNPGDDPVSFFDELPGRNLEVINSFLIDSILYFSIQSRGEENIFTANLETGSIAGILGNQSGRFQVQKIEGETLLLIQDIEGSKLFSADDGTTDFILFMTLPEGVDLNEFNRDLAATSNDSIVFFTTTESFSAWSVWRSNGLESGTFPIYASNTNGFTRSLTELTIFKERLYFREEKTSSRTPILRSDEHGRNVEVFEAPTQDGRHINPEFFRIKNEKLWFIGEDSQEINLYTSDGDTVIFVRNIGSEFSSIDNLIVTNNHVLWSGNNRLFGGSLQESETTMLGLHLRPERVAERANRSLTLLANDELFFVLDTPESGAELWSIDSNSLEPHLVEDIYRGELPSDIEGVYRYDDMVYLGAKAGCTGFELFSAKRNGVTLEIDANTSLKGSLPEDMFATSNSLFFTAQTGASGRELFVSDGTGEQTYLLKDFTPGRAGETNLQAVEYQGVTYFHVQSTSLSNNFRNAGIYKTNGTRSGTEAILSVDEGSRSGQFSKPFIFKDKIIFFSNLFGSTSLISYDPATETLDTLAREFHQMHFFYGDIVQLNEDAFMVESLSSNGILPFISDGTREGTRPLDDLLGHNIVNGINFKNAIFYGHQGAGGNEELFRTDGTVSGTYSITEENLPNASFLWSAQPLNLNDTLYFTVNSSVGRFFYGTEGVPGDYFEIPYPEGTMFYPSRRIETLDGDIYFPGIDETGYRYLYRTNADKSAFERISDIPAGPFLQQPVAMNVFNGYVYFNGFSEAYGEELYRTDGSDTGTERLSDINPGANFASPIFLTVFKDAVYFTASDGILGFELWRYDEGGITGMNNPFASANCPAVPNSTDYLFTDGNITITPNPADDKISVELPEGFRYDVSVYSMNGQLVKTILAFTSGDEISLTDLSAGGYIIRFRETISGQTTAQKLLIQR